LSEQVNNEPATDSRDAELIKCLQDVENNLSKFLKVKDARGTSILMDGVGKLSAEPENAIAILRKAFREVVDPILLDNFEGTWMAFLLWNDFTRRVQILYNYSKTTQIPQYDFVSGFVRSQEFEREFSEPMTDIIFTEGTTEKHVMVFSWGKHPEGEVLKRITDVPTSIQPLLVAFDDLGGKWQERIDEIQVFVNEAAADLEEKHRKTDFARLAKEISALSTEMLADSDGGVSAIIEKAKDVIKTKFELPDSVDGKQLIDPVALCRTLIWNRLFDPEWKYLYYIPAKFLAGSAVSGIVCAFRDILPPRDYIVLTQIVNRIFSLFHFGSYGQQLNQFALRSATAAIMARNKSHIHGSHIEHGLRNKMEDFSNVIEERLTSNEPFYRSLREKLGILDDSTPKAALEVRIEFIEELGTILAQAVDFDEQVRELDNNRRDLSLLEDVSEWMDRVGSEEKQS
jgi:hypothetical protein